jgi:hypothetical protein
VNDNVEPPLDREAEEVSFDALHAAWSAWLTITRSAAARKRRPLQRAVGQR